MESTTDKYGHIKRCINCGLALPVNYRKYYTSSLQPKCQEILKHWTGCETLTDYQICTKCGDIIDEYSESKELSIPERRLGYPVVCIGCGMSLRNKTQMTLKRDLIPIAIDHWPWYNILQVKQISCRKCIQRLQRIIGRENRIKQYWETTENEFKTNENESETTKSELRPNYEIALHTTELGTTANKLEISSDSLKMSLESQYVLVPCPDPNTNKPMYKIVKKSDLNTYTMNKLDKTTKVLKLGPVQKCQRMSDIVKRLDKSNFPQFGMKSNSIILSDGKKTSRQLCYVSRRCGDNSQKRVPKSKRRLLATNFNLFVPANSRVCGKHILFDKYDPNQTKHRHSNFTVPQFEAFIDEIKLGMAVIDFENVEAMADHICEYWTGLRVTQFMEMYEGLNQPKLMKTALAAYLIRKITGDSLQKLAKLFNLNSVTLKRHVRAVENHFSDN